MAVKSSRKQLWRGGARAYCGHHTFTAFFAPMCNCEGVEGTVQDFLVRRQGKMRAGDTSTSTFSADSNSSWNIYARDIRGTTPGMSSSRVYCPNLAARIL